MPVTELPACTRLLTGDEQMTSTADSRRHASRETDGLNGCGHAHHDHHHAHRLKDRSRRGLLSLDMLGIVASGACVVHCVALPFVVALIPSLGLQFLEGNFAHRLLAGFVLSFALLAVLPGYMKHKQTPVLFSMVAGLSLVLFATFARAPLMRESYELPLITAGNFILVLTHMRNRRLVSCPVASH